MGYIAGCLLGLWIWSSIFHWLLFRKENRTRGTTALAVSAAIALTTVGLSLTQGDPVSPLIAGALYLPLAVLFTKGKGKSSDSETDSKQSTAVACPHCKRDCSAAAKYCRHCAGRLRRWRCQSCKTRNQPDSKFCEKCAAPAPVAAQTEPAL
jgi:hypothetical protein